MKTLVSGAFRYAPANMRGVHVCIRKLINGIEMTLFIFGGGAAPD